MLLLQLYLLVLLPLVGLPLGEVADVVGLPVPLPCDVLGHPLDGFPLVAAAGTEWVSGVDWYSIQETVADQTEAA